MFLGGMDQPQGRARLRPAAIAFGVALAALTTGVSPSIAASSLAAPRVTNGDLVVDKTATIALSGFADPATSGWSTWIAVDINPASIPCGPDRDLNSERRIGTSGTSTVNDGTVTDAVVTWMPTSAGPFLLCAYLHQTGSNSWASSSAAVAVRPPATDLKLSLPAPRLSSSASTPLTITASAEVARKYTVEVNPIGVPCGPNVEANADAQMWIWDDDIVGGPTTVVSNVSAPDSGHFHLCGYVGTGTTDPSPTSIVEGPAFWAGRASCKFNAAPRRATGRVKMACTNTDGPIKVTAQRGRKRFVTTVALTSGRGSMRGRAVGLRRGARISLTASVDGQRAGTRILRVRR